MMLHLFRRTPRDHTIASLYGTIVAQARVPAFYQIYRVPDTVNGRLEMLMLHAVLVLRRLEGGAAGLRRLGQGLFDRFCRDMDDSLREMGVGDLAVPRTMRRIGEAFYGRQTAYRTALAALASEASGQRGHLLSARAGHSPEIGSSARADAADGPLTAALQRNVFAGAPAEEAAARLAVYVREAERALAAQSEQDLERAQLTFPDPEQVLVGTHGKLQ